MNKPIRIIALIAALIFTAESCLCLPVETLTEEGTAPPDTLSSIRMAETGVLPNKEDEGRIRTVIRLHERANAKIKSEKDKELFVRGNYIYCQTTPELAKFQVQRLKDLGFLGPDKKFVDLGCGDGLLVDLVEAMTQTHSTGLDRNAYLLDMARKTSEKLSSKGIVDSSRVHWKLRDIEEEDLSQYDVLYIYPSMTSEGTTVDCHEIVRKMKPGAVIFGWGISSRFLEPLPEGWACRRKENRNFPISGREIPLHINKRRGVFDRLTLKDSVGGAPAPSQNSSGQVDIDGNKTKPLPFSRRERQRGVDYANITGAVGIPDEDWHEIKLRGRQKELYDKQHEALVDTINEGLVAEDKDTQYQAVWLLERYLTRRPEVFTDMDLSFFLGASDACAEGVIREIIKRKNKYLLMKAAFGRGLAGIVIKLLKQAMDTTYPKDSWLKKRHKEISSANRTYLGYQHRAQQPLTSEEAVELEGGEVAQRVVWLKEKLRRSMGVNYKPKCETTRFVFGETTVYHIQPPYGGNITIFAYGEGENRRYTLIDTGIGAYYHELVDYLSNPLYDSDGNLLKETIDPKRIEHILITHYDTDHAACAAMFSQDYGIPISCHPSYLRVINNRVQGSQAAKAFTDFAKLLMVMTEPEDAVQEFDRDYGGALEIGRRKFKVIGEDVQVGTLKLRPLENTGAGTKSKGSHTEDYTYYAMFEGDELIGIVTGELLPLDKSIRSDIVTDRDKFLDALVLLNDGEDNVNASTRLFVAEIRAIQNDPRIRYAFPGHDKPRIRGADGLFRPIDATPAPDRAKGRLKPLLSSADRSP